MNLKRSAKRFYYGIKRFTRKEDMAGIYITVIFHLTVIIVLLASKICSITYAENSFAMDFSKQEERERIEEERAFKEDISRKLDEMLGVSKHRENDAQQIRNIATDANSRLKDDRGTDAEQLYKDAERLERELKYKSAIEEEDMRDETVDLTPERKRHEAERKEYKGPSVVSYSLDGRKASRLPIPAYRCIDGGDVTVIITVDNNGNVLNAKILEDVSATSQCLRNFAIRAARLSKFNRAGNAATKQTGEIVYRFIAQ